MTKQTAVSGFRAHFASQPAAFANLLSRKCNGLASRGRRATFELRLISFLCVAVFASCFAPLSPAQQINFNSFNIPQAATPSDVSITCPAGTNILFCFNYTGFGPSFTQYLYPPLIDPNFATDGGVGSTNYALQVTQNAGSQDSSVWFSVPQDVVDGFTTWYAVRINYQGGGDGNTADGMAFVIQNAVGGKTDSIANCPETGSGPNVVGTGGGCLGYGGIDNSVALEMDTFFSSWDPQQFSRSTSYSDNHLALQSCGLDASGNPLANSPAHTTSPNCLITLGNGMSTLITNPVTSVAPAATASSILLSDGNPHQIVMVYNGPNESPANYLWVYLDATYLPGTHTPVAGSVPMFSGPFDITKYMKLSNGSGPYSPAYVGFTAGTGGDYEQHEVLAWTFTSHANQPNFGPVTVCAGAQTGSAGCNETLAYTFNFPNGATLGTAQVVTQGAPGLDFNLASSTCTGTVPAGGSCGVNVTFAPLAPGLRTGSVNLYDNNGAQVASTLIYGVGQSPAAAFSPGPLGAVNTGAYSLNQPKGLATDAAGNLYIADTGTHNDGNRNVLKIAPNGSVTPIGSGLLFPQGIAVDGAGDLFVADNDLNQVIKIPFGCTSSVCQQVLPTPQCNGNVSGLCAELGVAVDGPGNVFIASYNSEVLEIAANGGAQTVLYNPAGSHPIGLAVDAGGNLFVADFGLKHVVKIPAGCTSASCQTLVGSGFNAPTDVAVDAAGDVFVTDSGLNELIEVPAGCSVSSCQIAVAAAVSTAAVAVDAVGNVYLDDLSNNTIFSLNRSQPPSLSFATTNVGSVSSDSPKLVSFQNIGNQTLNATLAVGSLNFAQVAGPGNPADCSASFALTPGQSCNVSLSFEPQSSGALSNKAVFSDNALNSPTSSQVKLSGTAISANFPFSVSLIGNGSGTVTDSLALVSCSEANGTTTGSCSASFASGSQITLTATPTASSTFLGWGGVCATFGKSPTCAVTISEAANATASFVNTSFGNVNVCAAGQTGSAPCSATIPVTYNLPTTTTVGAIKVVTQGLTGLDFSLGSGSTCSGIITGGSSCTVNVNFSPLAPGLRMGAVQLYDNNANLVESTPVFGVGQGPVIAFGPGTQTTLIANISGAGPGGVAVDAAGNVFVAGGPGAIKLTPSGVQSTLPVSGSFYDVALDGAGNLYFADTGNNRIVELTPGGVQTILPTTGLSSPTGVAVDGSGNVFITDRDNNRVVEVAPNGVQTTVPTTGVSLPYYPAVDAAGDLFFLSAGTEQVYKVTPGGVQSIVPISGLIEGNGVAVDAAGDVFVSDQVANVILEVTASGVQTTVPTTGLNVPSGLAVDAAGNVFIAVNGQNRWVEVNRSQVPSLSFPVTNVGSTSGPQSVSIQNVGNQPLTGSLALNLGGNFTQTAVDCSAAFPLAPGASCGETFSFTPQSAAFLSGTALFADNNQNLAASAQTITLSGTGATNGVPGLATVPNVVGQPQAAASTPLISAGLALGTLSTASSQTVLPGSIISQNPAAGTQVAVGSTVNLLVSSGLPQPPAPDPLSLNNNYFLTGDYVSAGVTLRGTGVGGTATGTITIPSYTQSATQGVPDGADIIDAFLYWETLENTPSASSTSGTFNHYQIVGQQIGSDIPNYVDGQFTGTIRSYRANVNLYLPVSANGVRFASGSYTVSLPDGATALPLTEGASLVLVYRVLSPNFPLKSVVIYDGSAATTVAGTQPVQGFYDAVGGASGTGKNTNIFASGGVWNNSVNTSATLGQSNQFNAPLNAASAYAAVILSTPVNNSDNDGILDAWKAGPPAGDFHAGQPGYYDVKTATWVGLPGAKHGQKDLFVQLDYMCGAVLSTGSCDPTQENLFPSPDANGVDPLALVQQAFANSGVQLHLQIGNAVSESTCTDDLTTSPATLCQFPGQPGVVGWKNSLEFSKLYPRNLLACLTGGDCTTRFPFGQKDSYHYLLMGHSLAIPAWNTRYGTLTSISVANGVTTIGTVDRGTGINACPSRITLSGVLGNPSLNGVYNTTGCADTKTITVATPGVPNYTYPNNTLPEPVIGLTSGTISSISGYSDLGGADSAVTLGLWLTAPNQDMSKKANVVAGTIFHEIGHTLGLSHGGLYYDTASSYVPTFEGNCKPNYQSIMNYLFQLDGVGPNQTVAFSNQTLNTLNETTAGSVTQLTDGLGNAATFPTSAWYVPYTTGSTASPATRHCDGTPLNGDSAYRVDAPIAPITPAWSNGQDLNFIGTLQTQERGFNDLANIDLRQVGATGGEFASLASLLSFGSSVAPLNITAGGNVALGSGGTVALGSGGTVTLGSGGNVTLGSGGTITLGSGGNVTLGSGGNVTLGSGGTITPGSGGTVTLGSGGNVTLGSGGTVTLGSGGTITLGSGGTVTLGSGGTVTLGSGGAPTVVPAGGTVTLGSGGTVTLGSGGNVTLGSGGNVTLGSGGTIALGSGGTVTLGSGGNVTLGSGGTIALGSGGTVALGSGGNVTLGSGGTIALGSGGTVTLGSGGNVTLGSGGTVTLGSGGNVALGSGGVTSVAAGGTVTLGSGGTVTLGSGGNVTLGSGGNVTLGSGGTIALGSGGNVTLGSGGNVTLGSGGTVTLGSGGTVTLGSGGTVTLGSGGTVTLGSGGTPTAVAAGGTVTLGSGGTVTLGSGGNVTLGSGGNVTLGSGGTITLGSGGNVTLGSGGNVTLGSGGTITLGSGGTITLGSGGNVTLGSGGNVTLGSGGAPTTVGAGGTVTLGSGGTITLGSGGNVTLGSGGTIALGSGGNVTLGSGGNVTLGSGGTITLGSGGTVTLSSAGTVTLGSGGVTSVAAGGTVTLGSGGTVTLGSGGTVILGSGGNITLGSGGNVTLGSGGNVTLGSGGTITLGSGGTVTLGSGGVVTFGTGGSINLGSGSATPLGSVSNITPASGGPSAANELTYETANSVVRTPTSPVETSTPTGVRITWSAPTFGVVQTYTIYRSSNGAPPIVIGSVSGVNGNPPATEFTDTNPDLISQTVVYTVTTTLVPDSAGPSRQSQQSVPAVLKNDQSITLGPLPSSVTITNPPTVTATATSGGVPNGLQVVFSATGSCTIGSQSLANNVTSAAVNLTGTGSCIVTASQPGTLAFNAANSVSGTFTVLPQGSSTQSQTINFAPLPSAQYGTSFLLSATSSASLPVSFSASGPCTKSGGITGVGVCTITASAPGNGTYSAASLTQSFTIYPAVLKVTATSLTSVYGQPLPSLTYTYTGFVNSDTSAVVSGAPVLSTTATATSNAGSYPITVSTGTIASANYSFLYVNGTLTVQPAQLTITPAGNKTKTYGATFTAFTGTISGLQNSDAVTATYASKGAAATAAVGSYDITVASYSFTSGSASNYSITENTATNGLKVLYASAGICYGAVGHTILQPINADGTSVWKAGRTIPTQFRVCDANGNSVGPTAATPNVVASYSIIGVYGGTVTTVEETVAATNNDTAFRWDSTGQQWIYNTATGSGTTLVAGYTYLMQIKLVDGTVIGSSGQNGTIPNAPFLGAVGYQFGLK